MNKELKPFPISALDTLADKQTIAAVEGTITACWPQKTGPNKTGDGQWAIQNAVLRTPDGHEVKLWLKDRTELSKDARNQAVRIEALQSDKGLSGIYVFDDHYNGVTTRKIKLTPSATIHFLADEPGGDAPAQQHAPADQDSGEHHWAGTPDGQQPPPPAQQHSPQRQPQNQKEREMAAARSTILQIANLHLICATAVERYEAPAYRKATGHDMPESQRQGAIASIFIESARNGLVRSMPTHGIEP